MAKKLKWLLNLTLIGLLMFSLIGCKKKDEENVEEQQDVVVEEEPIVEEPEVPVIPANQNLLTGLADLSEEAIGKRPVAVMVNNVKAALPQYGIAQADIIFEMNIEGDQTRLMALYADYTAVPKVCGVRSCRYYFPVMAHGFDAFYVNWGFDESIRSYVEGLGIPYFDGMANPGKMFGRDKDRKNAGYAVEHTAYFDGTKFANYVQEKDYRLDLLEEKKGTAFLFNGMDEQIKPTGNACATVDVDFGATEVTFTYDSTTNTYLKQFDGKNHMDGVTGTQLAFTNVFILETSVTMRDDGVHKAIDWEGSEDSVGYYISNGAVQKIHWSKADEGSYLKFYDENGQELGINRGKSYIGFCRPDNTAIK